MSLNRLARDHYEQMLAAAGRGDEEAEAMEHIAYLSALREPEPPEDDLDAYAATLPIGVAR